MLQDILSILLAFMLGSIPFGVIVCERSGLNPPSSYGSGNIGASNVARQNKMAGLLTLLLDSAKGFLAIKLFGSLDIVLLSVVMGHCYSPLLNYKGGKGVATYGGGLIALNPALAVTLFMLWVLILIRDKTPAKSSISISVVSIIYAILTQKIILLTTALLIVFRHKNNVLQKT